MNIKSGYTLLVKHSYRCDSRNRSKRDFQRSAYVRRTHQVSRSRAPRYLVFLMASDCKFPTERPHSTGDSESGKRVVICGGGIVGASVAYFLSKRGVSPTVVEREHVAAAASGKAAGFLTLDWNDGSPVGPLARASFELHEKLADEFGREQLGYRKLDTVAVAVCERGDGNPHRHRRAPNWVDGNVEGCQVLGTTASTAQVHPERLTRALMDASGASLVIGKAEGLVLEPLPGGGSCVRGVRVGGDVIECDAAVIAMGPWSSLAARWLPIEAVTGQKYHSILLQPKEPVGAHALFTNITLASGAAAEPEVYPRPDGQVYVCGEPEAVPVPESPSGVRVSDAKCARIHRQAGIVSSRLAGAELAKAQSCFLPISPTGLPVIGPVEGVDGAIVATGLGCWGILNAPMTGKIVSEMIVDGRVTSDIDVEPFLPRAPR
uniref:Fad-dependent oxidoreductase family protein n=1 Tax=Tetraselmis sp. GSL018 TaxID=582737 RepID=A0A061QYQ9_9CHLO